MDDVGFEDDGYQEGTLRAFAIALLLITQACSAPAAKVELWREDMVSFPVVTAQGESVPIRARLCRPAIETRARLVVINHGSPPNADDRPGMRPMACDSEAVQWFVSRGNVVLLPMRRGYGPTGGLWAETYGRCDSADYVTAGRESARDIAAAVAWGTAQPFARRDGVVVVGQSAGGWGVLALDSQPHPKVAAFISMAGGRGGHMDNVPNRNCHPERLVQAAGTFGATATTPMLWVYAANDSFFSPSLAEQMYTSFMAAGGKATIEQPGPFGRDGHGLFNGRGGSAVWGPMVERYLTQRLAAS